MADSILPMGDISTTMNSLSAPPSSFALASKLGTNANIDKAAEDFEAMFATQMLQPMFEGIQVDSTFGGGHGEEVMRSFMLQEYGKMIAKGGKLGIAAQVKSEMLRAQEGSNRKAANAHAAQNAYASATVQRVTNASIQ